MINEEIKAFTQQFIDNYNNEIIQEDIISFYNDGFAMIQHFKDLNEVNDDIAKEYKNFISYFISKESFYKEYSSFDFSNIATIDQLQKENSTEQLKPIYTTYSFLETEETIDQIFEELKVAKEFQKELKEEISYLLEEYKFHLDHLEENMMYDFYIYNELQNVENLEEAIDELQIEKQKFLQKCNDKLNKK